MHQAAKEVIFSSLTYAIMTAAAKWLEQAQIPVFEIVAFRCLVSLVISYIAIKRKGISPFGQQKGLLLLRGLFGFAGAICIFYAVVLLPLAEATIIQFTYPVFTLLLAFLFLKEPVKLLTLFASLISLTGIVIMLYPELIHLDFARKTALSTLGIGVALLAALSLAATYVVVKKLAKTEDSEVTVFYFPLVGLPLSLLLLGEQFVMPSLTLFIILLVVGICSQLSQLMLSNAMHQLSAGIATAYRYTQIVFSILIGWLVFNEVPVIWTYIGGVFILAGTLLNIRSDDLDEGKS